MEIPKKPPRQNGKRRIAEIGDLRKEVTSFPEHRLNLLCEKQKLRQFDFLQIFGKITMKETSFKRESIYHLERYRHT